MDTDNNVVKTLGSGRVWGVGMGLSMWEGKGSNICNSTVNNENISKKKEENKRKRG